MQLLSLQPAPRLRSSNTADAVTLLCQMLQYIVKNFGFDTKEHSLRHVLSC